MSRHPEIVDQVYKFWAETKQDNSFPTNWKGVAMIVADFVEHDLTTANAKLAKFEAAIDAAEEPECSGCEVCQFEGDGSCEIYKHQVIAKIKEGLK
jgi:hypothetical protein